MQSPEAEAFLQRLSTPGVTVPIAIQPSIDDELVLRRLFATKRTHSRLQNPHVGLVNVYGPGTDGIRHIRARVVEDAQDLDKRYLFPLSDDVRKKDGELAMAETFADFRTRWEIFTEGSLGALLDWNNIIAAGGSVLACLLPLPDEVVAKGSTRAIRKHYHTKAFPASDVDLFLYGLTPEEVGVSANADILYLRTFARPKPKPSPFTKPSKALYRGRSPLLGPSMPYQYIVRTTK